MATLPEILLLLKEIEEFARDFYHDALKITHNRLMINVFSELEQAEIQHAALVEELISEVDNSNLVQELNMDPLHKMFSQFKEQWGRMGDKASDKELCLFAMKIENELQENKLLKLIAIGEFKTRATKLMQDSATHYNKLKKIKDTYWPYE